MSHPAIYKQLNILQLGAATTISGLRNAAIIGGSIPHDGGNTCPQDTAVCLKDLDFFASPFRLGPPAVSDDSLFS